MSVAFVMFLLVSTWFFVGILLTVWASEVNDNMRNQLEVLRHKWRIEQLEKEVKHIHNIHRRSMKNLLDIMILEAKDEAKNERCEDRDNEGKGTGGTAQEQNGFLC
jgi:hypothetical protein